MKFKCHYVLQKSNSTLERWAQLPSTPDDGTGGNVADYLSLYGSGDNRAHDSLVSWLAAWHPYTYSIFFNPLHHIFSDLKIHMFCRGQGSWSRTRGVFSISKLWLLIFLLLVLPPSYREQSELISIWFETNGSDSKGRTNAGGNDASVLSRLSLCNRTIPYLLLLPDQNCRIHFDLRRSGQTLRHRRRSRNEMFHWGVVIPSFSQQWRNCVSLISITHARCCSKHKLLSVCERFACSLLCISTLQCL